MLRGYVLFIWSIIDPFYFFCSRLSYIPNKSGEAQMMRVRLTKYKGWPVVLSDGTKINKNDLLVKVHLHNVRILKEVSSIKNELKKARIIFRHVQQSLPGVELYIRNNPCAKEIKGIIGISFLHKGCERLGFETAEISNPMYAWFKWLAFLPIELLSRRGFPIQNVFDRKPKYLFMSTTKLVNLYKK